MEWVCRGQKKRQRGGASEAEGGLLGARDGWQYSLFPSLSPAVSHTEQ